MADQDFATDGISQMMPMAQLQLHQQQLADAQRTSEFWGKRMAEIQSIDPHHPEIDWASPELPLARIKKIMKAEDDVKAELGSQKFMISAEAPIMFAKACEIFALEMTEMAWQQTEENKRRTLQRIDIVAAVSKNDTYDFLIDIVPREAKGHAAKNGPGAAGHEVGGGHGSGVGMAAVPMMDPAQIQQLLAMQAAAVAAGGAGLGGDQPAAPTDGGADAAQAAAGAGMALDPQQMLQFQLMWQQQLAMQQQWRLQAGAGEDGGAAEAPKSSAE